MAQMYKYRSRDSTPKIYNPLNSLLRSSWTRCFLRPSQLLGRLYLSSSRDQCCNPIAGHRSLPVNYRSKSPKPDSTKVVRDSGHYIFLGGVKCNCTANRWSALNCRLRDPMMLGRLTGKKLFERPSAWQLVKQSNPEWLAWQQAIGLTMSLPQNTPIAVNNRV